MIFKKTLEEKSFSLIKMIDFSPEDGITVRLRNVWYNLLQNPLPEKKSSPLMLLT